MDTKCKCLFSFFLFWAVTTILMFPADTQAKDNKFFQGNGRFSSDTTILYIEYVTTDYFGIAHVKKIFCKEIKKKGSTFSFIRHNGDSGFFSPGDFKYDINIKEIELIKMESNNYLDNIP